MYCREFLEMVLYLPKYNFLKNQLQTHGNKLAIWNIGLTMDRCPAEWPMSDYAMLMDFLKETAAPLNSKYECHILFRLLYSTRSISTCSL